MHKGKCIVFEDIDRGSNEMLVMMKLFVKSLHLGEWICRRSTLLDVPAQFGRLAGSTVFIRLWESIKILDPAAFTRALVFVNWKNYARV